MNIIFLDIDGVLNSMPYFLYLKKNHIDDEYNQINDYNLQMLSKIYHACNAKIVLSSSWRTLNDPKDKESYKLYESLLRKLNDYDMEIFSQTPVINNNRPLEIYTWLSERSDKENINFVIIDDDFNKEDYEEYDLSKNLVQTQFYCDDIESAGLTKKLADIAISILKGNYK